MNDIVHIRTDDKWRLFCHNYLIRAGFCIQCEDKGKLSTATIVYQPTPEEDRNKRKFSEYNLKPLCAECFYSLQINQAIKSVIKKFIGMALLFAAIAYLIKIIF